MIRARFKTYEADPRPLKWPIKHPYWVTGYGEGTEEGGGYAIIVAYADNQAEILTNWPEAIDIDADPADGYIFTGRFPKPKWFTETT